MNIIGMESVIKRYYHKCPAGHWFDKGTMRFFASRLAQTGYENEQSGEVFFVTSEQDKFRDTNPRLYSVRVQRATGEIDTIGEFQGYSSRRVADREARRLANE